MSSGGEADVNSQYKNTNKFAGASRQFKDRSLTRALLCRCRTVGAAFIVAALGLSAGELQAQQRIALANSAHTTTVTVMMGKSVDVHTDQNFVDITVGDPEIADVNPLTDHALSILGKKIGTTRVTVYDEGKKTVGIFDIEVAYDVSRLNAEIVSFAGGGIRVSSVNGRILLSGKVADAVTLDKAVTIARQFVPDVINTVQVMQAQQIMLEVRFIEASRQASRELGVQWNMFTNSTVANIGNQVPATQLPITAPGGAFQQPAAANSGIGGPSVIPSNVSGTPLSPIVAAGVLSGSAPFGFLVSQLSNSLQLQINALEQKGLARSLAEPNLVALSGDTASFLAGGQFPVPEASGLGTVAFAYQPYGVGLLIHPDRAQGRADQPRDQAGGERDRPYPYRDGSRHLGARAHHPQGLDNSRVARRPELHAWRAVAEHKHDRAGPAAVGRRRAGARRSVPLQPVPEERDRSGDFGDAAHRPSAVIDGSDSYAARTRVCRPTTSTFSLWAKPRSARRWRGWPSGQ